MHNFIRPEIRQFVSRWREVLVAVCVSVLGLWWATQGIGIVRWLGGLVIGIGLVWIYAGTQRVRFAQDGEGAGVVQVRERRLGYFGPVDGGVMDMDDMNMLELDPTTAPDPSWILTGMGGQRVAIPINAAGAEELFDVFAALPGINTSSVLDVLSRTPDARVVIWSRVKPLLH